MFQDASCVPKGEPEFQFRGTLLLRHQSFLSLLEARRLMTVECDSFLTCVTSSSAEEVGESSSSLYSMHVVCEFVDIFFEDLLGCHLHVRWSSPLSYVPVLCLAPRHCSECPPSNCVS